MEGQGFMADAAVQVRLARMDALAQLNGALAEARVAVAAAVREGIDAINEAGAEILRQLAAEQGTAEAQRGSAADERAYLIAEAGAMKAHQALQRAAALHMSARQEVQYELVFPGTMFDLLLEFYLDLVQNGLEGTSMIAEFIPAYGCRTWSPMQTTGTPVERARSTIASSVSSIMRNFDRSTSLNTSHGCTGGVALGILDLAT
jgi:hypothetical protein